MQQVMLAFSSRQPNCTPASHPLSRCDKGNSTVAGRRVPAVLSALLICCLGCPRTPPAVVRLVPEGTEESPLELGRVSRMGFMVPAGDEMVVSFTAPKRKATLWLACGVSGDAEKVVFRALLRRSGADSELVLDRIGTPGEWTEAAVDLSEKSGKKMELVLRSEHLGPPTTGAVYWATPLITAPNKEGPNVLLICIDSLRADHLGCYGYSRATSPTLDSLAAAGCLFTGAVAQSSWTLPSVTSLFTSQYVRSHGVYSKGTALGPKACTLAELLRQAGYVVGAVVAAPSVAPTFGLAQGFDLFDVSCSVRAGGDIHRDVTNPCVNERAEAWLNRWGKAPFFLFIHYWDVHFDYNPPAPYDTLFDLDYRGSFSGANLNANEHIRPGMPPSDFRHLVALYDGEIRHTDRWLGMLLRELRHMGLSDNTLVVVTSDHGDEFLEHGGKSHGHTLFQELIHVPLIWVEPGSRSDGSVVEDLVQTVDISPSVLDFVGLEPPPDMAGRSFLRLTKGGRRDPRPAFAELLGAAETPVHLAAILTTDGKIIHSPSDGWTRAYNLAEDPGELHPAPPEAFPWGSALERALAAFDKDEQPALKVRVVGAGPPRRLLLRITSDDPLLDVNTVNLETGDSVGVKLGGRLVELKAMCPSGDVDEITVHLTSDTTSVGMNVTLDRRRISPEQVFLGGAEHPSSLPLSLRGGDRCLQHPREPPFPHTSPKVPVVYVWVEHHPKRTLSVERQTRDDALSRRLRTLGYLR